MNFCVIGSGSRGNSTYITTSDAKVLLDAGISMSDAIRRSDTIDFEGLDAIFITHEHSDHRKFLGTIIKRTDATLYINKLSFMRLPQNLMKELVNRRIVFIEANKKYKIKDLEILTLELVHDSAANMGYIFGSNGSKLASITDTGYIPSAYFGLLKDVDALIIEANHDIEMLMESNRDWFLKERILSPEGHMSNHICLEILKGIITKRHKIIILAHVSQDCNSIEIIENEIIKEVKEIYSEEIVIASQYEASEFYTI